MVRLMMGRSVSLGVPVESEVSSLAVGSDVTEGIDFNEVGKMPASWFLNPKVDEKGGDAVGGVQLVVT